MTIRDVARVAGVGLGTVSRVLNGGANVSPAMREKVGKAIQRLNFRPHAQARRILRRRAGMVCFLLSNRDFIHSFHARILQGVETYLTSRQQHVVFAVVHYEAGTRPDAIPLPPILQERGWVDGLILAGMVYPNFLRRIQSLDVPFVALANNVVRNPQNPEFDQVSFDEVRGEMEATRYVIRHGHRKIVFVGDVSYPWIHERYRGYLKAMQARRFRSLSVTARRNKDFTAYGEWAAARVLGMRPRPTAVMAGNDEIAYGMWRALRRQGVTIPREMNLVGFDDRDEALLMDPSLTTVRVHKEDLGQNLAQLLLEKLHRPGGPHMRRILATELIVRGTTCDL
jgi:LacI family transcriptional regulator